LLALFALPVVLAAAFGRCLTACELIGLAFPPSAA
jgi:hypothetical protein